MRWLLVSVLLVVPSLASSLRCYLCVPSPAVGYKAVALQQSRPAKCNPMFECTGQWCVQHMRDNNLSYYCANQSPNSHAMDESVNSFCQALVFDGSNHAKCYCRGRDYCNSVGSSLSLYVMNPLCFLLCMIYAVN